MMMEGGIEDRDLRNLPQKSFHDRDTLEFGSIVKRRECRSACDGAFHFSGDDDRLFELTTAVNNPMTHDMDFRGLLDRTSIAVPERAK